MHIHYRHDGQPVPICLYEIANGFTQNLDGFYRGGVGPDNIYYKQTLADPVMPGLPPVLGGYSMPSSWLGNIHISSCQKCSGGIDAFVAVNLELSPNLKVNHRAERPGNPARR